MDDKFANLLTTNPPNLEEIKSIMVEGIVDINRVDKIGYTPLLCLIQMSKGDYLLEVISLLLEHGVDVNHKDKDGWNALYFLCHYHQQKDNLIEIIKLLIKNGIDVKWKPHNENNILHFYCKNYKGEHFIDIVDIFLKNGVEMVSDGFDARNLVNNPKYPPRKNVEQIIDLMDNIVL
jgi:ankyrin repeat protein